MREIKFRAWDGFAQGWDYCKLEDLVVPVIFSGAYFQHKNWCQYTGLQDKNGKEIYEEDIVEWTTYNSKHKNKGLIKWDTGSAGFVIENPSMINVYFHQVIVVGNIYENPDLVK